ncbi:hypothetical protein [Streptomyces sp. NPDC093225]|uniref:hypothetical protein n=1 Tax=Streptomyces sp. NPDC093225 TaxID=3366034 RepID=UPI00382E9259
MPLALIAALASRWLGDRMVKPLDIDNLMDTLLIDAFGLGISSRMVVLIGAVVNKSVHLMFGSPFREEDVFEPWRAVTHAIVGAALADVLNNPAEPEESPTEEP